MLSLSHPPTHTDFAHSCILGHVQGETAAYPNDITATPDDPVTAPPVATTSNAKRRQTLLTLLDALQELSREDSLVDGTHGASASCLLLLSCFRFGSDRCPVSFLLPQKRINNRILKGIMTSVSAIVNCRRRCAWC